LKDNDWVIPSKELKFGAELGRGAYGIVYKGEWRREDVAIKKLIMTELTDKQLDEFKAEVNLMKKLRPHANVVSLRGVIVDDGLCLVTELMHGGSLADFLYEKKEY